MSTATAPPQAPNKPRLPRPPRVIDTRQKFVNIMVYGDPGVGKTLFSVTGPGPYLILDVDDGTLSLENPPQELVKSLGLTLDDIYHERIRALDGLIQAIKRIGSELRQEPGFYQTVVVDNLTELQRVLMDDLLAKNQRSTPEIRDWGVILRQMQHIVSSVKALPCHCVFIAHEENKEARIAPSLAGRIQEELPGYVDIVARYVLLEQETRDPQTGEIKLKTIRKLRCRPQAGQVKVLAKDRSGRLSDWEDPHFSRLIEKIRAR